MAVLLTKLKSAASCTDVDGPLISTQLSPLHEQLKLDALLNHGLMFRSPKLCDPDVDVKQYSGNFDVTDEKYFWSVTTYFHAYIST